MPIYRVSQGEHLEDVAHALVLRAAATHLPMHAVFNGVELHASPATLAAPATTEDHLVLMYRAAVAAHHPAPRAELRVLLAHELTAIAAALMRRPTVDEVRAVAERVIRLRDRVATLLP